MHGVYLFTVAKAFFNGLHPRQPFQGLRTDIESVNIEDHVGCSISP
jgi:hypothetical protein